MRTTSDSEIEREYETTNRGGILIVPVRGSTLVGPVHSSARKILVATDNLSSKI